MSHSIKAAYGNSPRAAVAFAVPPPRCFIPLRRRLLLVYVCGPTHCQTKAQPPLLRSVGSRCCGDGATATLRSAGWMMPRGCLRNVGTNRPIPAQRRPCSIENRSQFLWQKNATDPEPRHHTKYATATAHIKKDEAYSRKAHSALMCE
jgi:hypothetical protein